MILTFDEEKHRYRLDGIEVPSVSELLTPITAAGYEKISPETLRIAAERGTEVHEACEALDYGLDPDDISEDVEPYLDAYTLFLSEHNIEWLGIEDMGACAGHKYYTTDYAGTVDRWGYIDGELCVVDIKTYASPTTEQKCAVALQTAAYEGILATKHPELENGFRHYALFLKKDGKYRLFDLDAFAEKEGFAVQEMLRNLTTSYCCKRYVADTVNEIKDARRRKK